MSTAAFDHGFESLSGFNSAFARFAGSAPTGARDQLQLVVTRLLTPLGPMVAVASDEALHLLEFTDRRMLETQLTRLGSRTGGIMSPGRNGVLDRTEEELSQYFAGGRTDFEVPLRPSGTEFQQSVWRALSEIPYGETRSYGDQARAIGRPTAVRAVASANGDNPIAIMIPCHRVIGSDGSLTGYGGGLPRKQFLLDLEGRVARGELKLDL